jgi:hypothetical protein
MQREFAYFLIPIGLACIFFLWGIVLKKLPRIAVILGTIVGVAIVLTGTILLVVSFRSTQEVQLTHPNPQEIQDEINKVATYKQGEIAKSYVDLPVTWAVTLFSINSNTGGDRIQASSVDNELISIFFTINIDDYPQLKIMKQGEEFIVQGTITSANLYYIDLGNCHPIFY